MSETYVYSLQKGAILTRAGIWIRPTGADKKTQMMSDFDVQLAGFWVPVRYEGEKHRYLVRAILVQEKDKEHVRKAIDSVAEAQEVQNYEVLYGAGL
jgi:hypothetical protein